jgi:hypothetical protein
MYVFVPLSLFYTCPRLRPNPSLRHSSSLYSKIYVVIAKT